MGLYALVADWHPGEIAAPTPLVRADGSLPWMAAEFEHELRWELADSEIEVPGDHLTMMEEHVESTAQAVQAWLAMTFDE